MADDFDALRTIREPFGDLDAERATRMRARALASMLDDQRAVGSVLTEAAPTRTGRPTPTDDDRAERPLEPVSPTPLPDRAADGSRRLAPLASPPGVLTDAGVGRGHQPAARRPFVVVLAAAAAIVAVLIGLAVARGGDRATVVSDQTRPTTVTDLAENAATLVDRPLPPGEYAHLRTEQGDPFSSEAGTLETHIGTREVWSTATGVGREKVSDTVIVDDDGQTVDTFEPGRDLPYAEDAPAFGSFDYDTLRALPTDPAQLRAALRTEGAAPGNDASIARRLVELLLFDTTPPGVRAAALAILAEDGATLHDGVTDPAGHVGFGIVAPRTDGLAMIYVVTRDGLLLGAYEVAAGGPLEPDEATWWTTLELQDRVATTG